MALTTVERESEHEAVTTLTDAVSATVSLIHDWGMVVVDEVSPVDGTGDSWSYTFSENDTVSSGVHKIRWNYVDSLSDEHTKDEFIEIVQRYVEKLDFFNKYPQLEDEFEPYFYDFEGVTRKIIDTFCGQDFQFVNNGVLTFDGTGGRDLYVGRRLDTYTSVLIDEDEVVSAVTGTSDDHFDRFLRITAVDGATRSRFTDGDVVTVTGNWGWPYVPSSISLAAETLILEMVNDDRINYTHGIDQIWMDTQRTEFKDGLFDTTGNLDVDTLLMDYTILGWDYV